MPGGLAIVITLVLAFFTPLTGASGVTILSMGGLLLPVLVRRALRGAHVDRPGHRLGIDRAAVLSQPSRSSSMRSTPTCRSNASSSAGSFPACCWSSVVAGWAAVHGWLHGAVAHAVRRPAGGRRRSGKPSGNCCCRSSCSAASSPGLTTLVEAAALGVLYARVRRVRRSIASST